MNETTERISVNKVHHVNFNIESLSLRFNRFQ